MFCCLEGRAPSVQPVAKPAGAAGCTAKAVQHAFSARQAAAAVAAMNGAARRPAPRRHTAWQPDSVDGCGALKLAAVPAAWRRGSAACRLALGRPACQQGAFQCFFPTARPAALPPQSGPLPPLACCRCLHQHACCVAPVLHRFAEPTSAGSVVKTPLEAVSLGE